MLQILKKIVATVIIAVILPLMSTYEASASGLAPGEQYFIITGYYSPLPNQEYYNMGTYSAEKRMNGEGIRGASGAKVYGGMVAAPGKYAFGTKIQLEGVGIASVEDRGGAIVQAGQRNFAHDRIDIWFGYGDEGLRRAMYWGKKTIKGKIISSNTPSYINIKNFAAPKWVSVRTKKNPYYVNPAIKTVAKDTSNKTHPFFNYGIGTKSAKSDVESLQKFLKEINLYSGEVDGVYNTATMQSVYNFQRANKLVDNWKHLEAGYWGYETRALVWKKYQNGDFKKIEPIQSVVKEVKATAKTIEKTTEKVSEQILAEKETVITEVAHQKNILSTTIESSADVELLQKELTNLRLYDGEITGDYNDIRDEILAYQIDREIISSSSDVGAGNYGPATREALRNRKIKLSEPTEEKATEKAPIEEEKKQEEQKETPKQEKTQTAKRVEALKGITFGDVSHEVRELQVILKELGYFNEKDTAIFGEKTKAAILKYQLDKEVIADKTVYGAGMFGPKTRAQLVIDLSNL